MRDATASSASRGKMPVRLRRWRRLAGGKSGFQIPPAQWAASRDRVDDPAKRHAFAVGTNSHIDLQTVPETANDFFNMNSRGPESHTSTKLRTERASFRLPRIDFSSSRVLGRLL